MIELPNIKALSPNPSGRELKQAIDSLRVWVAALKKSGNVPTIKDFVTAKVISSTPSGFAAYDETLAVPPAPSSVIATGVVGGIVVSWNGASYPGHSITEVWRSTVDSIGDAVLIGSSNVAVYTDVVPDGSPKTIYYYWLRFRNTNGVTGPYNAIAGTAGNMMIDPQIVVDSLIGRVTSMQLATELKSTIDLIDINMPLQGQLDGINSATSALSTNITAYTEQFTDSFKTGANDLLQAILDTDSAFKDIAVNSTNLASLQAELSGSIALFSSDATAQIDALNAITAQSTTLQTSMDNNTAAITAEQIARSDADSAQANTLTLLQTKVGNNTSAITAEQSSRATADTAEVTARKGLAAQILGQEGDASASGLIYTKNKALADTDSAIAESVNTLDAKVNGIADNFTVNEAGVVAESKVRAERDTALAQRSDRMFAETSNAEGALETLLGGDAVAEKARTTTATYEREITTVTTNLTAEATARETLAAKVASDKSEVTGYITTEATTRANEDGALAQKITTLQTTTGTNAAAIQTEATTRANEDGALAQKITTVQTTVGTHTTAIQEQGESIDGVMGQWGLKIDTDGNVCGIGLMSALNDEGGVSSQFGINVDTFFMTKPGASGVYPFIISELDPVGAPNVYTLGLNADVLINGTLSVQQLTTGKLPTNAVVQIGDGITLNGDGSIIVAEAGGITGNDYVLLTNGQLQYMVFNGTDHVPSKALRNIEMGVAATGQTVSIPGYWKNQPKVMCMLQALESYSANTAGQSQSWSINAGAVEMVSAGSYQFTPTAQLVLSAGSGTVTVNGYLGNSTDDSYLYFPTEHSQANCTKLTPTIKARSIEATAAGYYQKKLCNWRIKYSRSSDLSSASYSTWRAKAIGTTTDWVADSMALPVSSGDWYFRVEAYFSNDSGTFAGPGTTLVEDTTNVDIVASDIVPKQNFIGALQATVSLGEMPIPAGFVASDLVSAEYEYELGIRAWCYDGTFHDGRISIYWTGIPNGTIYIDAADGIYLAGEYNTYSDTFTSLVKKSFTQDSWVSSVYARLYGSITSDASAGWGAIKVQNPKVTLLFRKTVSPSTTPDNDIEFESYTYELSSKTSLADGTVTWVAIGD